MVLSRPYKQPIIQIRAFTVKEINDIASGPHQVIDMSDRQRFQLITQMGENWVLACYKAAEKSLAPLPGTSMR